MANGDVDPGRAELKPDEGNAMRTNSSYEHKPSLLRSRPRSTSDISASVDLMPSSVNTLFISCRDSLPELSLSKRLNSRFRDASLMDASSIMRRRRSSNISTRARSARLVSLFAVFAGERRKKKKIIQIQRKKKIVSGKKKINGTPSDGARQ